jgi:ribonuclease HII
VILHPEARLTAGVDEAGRGPLAGPVVAAAVILDPSRPIAGLADSKALTPARRGELADLVRERALVWGIGVASHSEIDQLNILRATMLAMRRAILTLHPAPLLLEVDGNRLPPLDGLPCRDNAVAIVRGDALRAPISAASILAKTTRDKLMNQLDERYPGYGFSIHKGYPTAAHLEALARRGPSAVHRLSFGPVRSALSTPVQSPARR